MTCSDLSILGTNIRVRRERRDLSQYDLADAAKVSRGTIAAIEGGHPPNLRILFKLAKALGTTPQALLAPPKRAA